MISYKLKNTTQFNLNCELIIKKFLNKIDKIQLVKTNCTSIYDIYIPWNTINLKVGHIELYESMGNNFMVRFTIFETNYSSIGTIGVSANKLVLGNTDEALKIITDFLNEHISWEVR
jgi:hypothetical protein